MQEKVPTSMYSMRLEPTKLTLIGTRTTYQATGDAGTIVYLVPGTDVILPGRTGKIVFLRSCR